MTQRTATTAMADLMTAITDLESRLRKLAEGHPNVIGIGAIVGGEVRGVFVLTASQDGDHYSHAVAEDRMRTWARIIGNMPANLRDAFEAELATIAR